MDRPTGSSHLSFTLGTLSAVGGLAGFLKTGSVPSLVAGVGIGGFYIYGGYLINQGQADIGHKVSLGASLLLVGAMVPRYLQTRRLWPAGVMGAAGILSLAYEGRRFLDWQ